MLQLIEKQILIAEVFLHTREISSTAKQCSCDVRQDEVQFYAILYLFLFLWFCSFAPLCDDPGQSATMEEELTTIHSTRSQLQLLGSCCVFIPQID